MRSKALLTVAKKEFMEVFRDSRTRFGVIVSPLILTPLLFALLGVVIGRQVKEAKKEVLPIGIVGANRAPQVMESLRGAPNVRWERTETQKEAEKNIEARKYRAALVLPPDADDALETSRPVRISVLFDQGSDASQEASKRLESLLTERGQRIVAQRLHDNALSSEIAIPFQTTQTPIAAGGKAATLILATFLPYILSLSAIMGSVYAANDSVAGEKERGTLETLLLAPLSRRDLVLGKFLAVAGVALVSSLLSVIGLLWPFYVPLEAFAWMAKGGLALRPVAIAAIILVQVPLAVLGAGVLLAVSTWSKNQKEAQTYLGPVLAVASVASVMSMLLKAEAGWPYAFVPVLNAALVLKQALEGTMSGLFIVLACLTSLVYAGAALWLAVHLFEKESVLLKA